MNKYISFWLGTNQIQLRAPELTSYDRINLKTVFGRNMDGSWWTKKSTPVTRLQILNFEGIRRDQVFAMITFLQNTQGSQIYYQDIWNTLWQGYIITPTSEFIYASRVGTNFSVQFESNL